MKIEEITRSLYKIYFNTLINFVEVPSKLKHGYHRLSEILDPWIERIFPSYAKLKQENVELSEKAFEMEREAIRKDETIDSLLEIAKDENVELSDIKERLEILSRESAQNKDLHEEIDDMCNRLCSLKEEKIPVTNYSKLKRVRKALQDYPNIISYLRAHNFDLTKKLRSSERQKIFRSRDKYVITVAGYEEILDFDPGKKKNDFLRYPLEKIKEGITLQDILKDPRRIDNYIEEFKKQKREKYEGYLEFMVNSGEKYEVLLKTSITKEDDILYFELERIKPRKISEFKGGGGDYEYTLPSKLTDDNCKKVCLDLRKLTREDPNKRLILNFAKVNYVPDKVLKKIEDLYDHFKDYCIPINTYFRPMTDVYSKLKTIFNDEIIPTLPVIPVQDVKGKLAFEGAK